MLFRRRPSRMPGLKLFAVFLIFAAFASAASAQSNSDEIEQLKKVVAGLETRVTTLEEQNAWLIARLSPAQSGGAERAAALVRAAAEMRSSSSLSAADGILSVHASEPHSGSAPAIQAAAPVAVAPPPAIIPANLPGGATLNVLLDGYYEYNFNSPPGRVNDLRAYDVLSNVFSINQADLVFAWDPDLEAKRRYGMRFDLQFGQATETLQGNPANETRPEIYRNIFQAYGTYIVPVGKGLNVDVGKWASSLGVEGNYTKDQWNYTRAYFFNFLPFYHEGARVSYHASDRLALNYWIINGTNQSEPTNGYKDELFGYVAQPRKSVTWTFNYYLGQEHPDFVTATNCPVPVQPGLCVAPIAPAANGKLHIFDSYATWQASHKLTLQGEMDYVIQRQWATAGPGRNAAPEHVIGGVVYAQYQLSPRINLATRGEYLSDRGGLFSERTQALKEGTATYQYKLSDWMNAFIEYRRDWSNRPYFLTGNVQAPSSHQDTAGIGLVWWYGGKQGAW